MKKFYSKYNKNIFAILVAGIVILLAGIILAVAVKNRFFEIKLALITFGGFATVFTAIIYCGYKSRWIALSEDKLVLPRGVHIVDANGKDVFCTDRISLSISKIERVERSLYDGDGVFLIDTYFYSFRISDGRKFILPLSSYTDDDIEQIFKALYLAGVEITF